MCTHCESITEKSVVPSQPHQQGPSDKPIPPPMPDYAQTCSQPLLTLGQCGVGHECRPHPNEATLFPTTRRSAEVQQGAWNPILEGCSNKASLPTGIVSKGTEWEIRTFTATCNKAVQFQRKTTKAENLMNVQSHDIIPQNVQDNFKIIHYTKKQGHLNWNSHTIDKQELWDDTEVGGVWQGF